jgi:uncharacterized protein YggU (UPF0235/DUF167 family)
MRIFVKAKPGAKVARVTRVDALDGSAHFLVAVKEPAIDGRANRAIEKALAEYFKVPPSRVRITRGHSAKQKVVEIAE